MIRHTTMFAAVALTLFASGCAKKMAAAPPPSSAAVAVTQAPNAATRAQVEEQLQAHFEKVFFAYDSSSIDARGRAALADAAKLMMQHPTLSVEVQGHCDERGTVDYNLGLGYRRAEAVKNGLIAGGVAPSRIKTVSYGEEKPAMKGRGESVWAANRRGELIPLWNGRVASAW